VYGRARSRSSGFFLTLGAAMIALAIVTQQSWAVGPRDAAKSLLAPLESIMTSVAVQAERVTGAFGDVAGLRAENARLRATDAQLQRRLIELNAAAKENATLRQALDFERAYGRRMMAAQVIGLGPDGFTRTLEIDRGSADGVEPGMVVTTGAGLLGRISEAGPHAAIVQTLADSQSRVNVFLYQSGLQGTVSGGPGALPMQVEHAFGATASQGDWALTSGVGGEYPRGLVVGEVSGVTYQPSSTSDEARIAWVNDPANLALVLVITDFLPS